VQCTTFKSTETGGNICHYKSSKFSHIPAYVLTDSHLDHIQTHSSSTTSQGHRNIINAQSTGMLIVEDLSLMNVIMLAT